MGERFVKKVQRLRDLTNLLLDYPDGLHKAEIARRIGVDRAQVTKDLDDLGHFEPVWEPIAEKLYSINRENYRAKIYFVAYLTHSKTDGQPAYSLKASSQRCTSLALRHRE